MYVSLEDNEYKHPSYAKENIDIVISTVVAYGTVQKLYKF